VWHSLSVISGPGCREADPRFESQRPDILNKEESKEYKTKKTKNLGKIVLKIKLLHIMNMVNSCSSKVAKIDRQQCYPAKR
jgi:hypothetical protein